MSETFVATTKAWPPPPDLDSIRELVATADIEGFIADGAPADEYEAEADELFSLIQYLRIAELVSGNIGPLLAPIWRASFSLDDAALAARQPALVELAQQIERFFGPESRPQVR